MKIKLLKKKKINGVSYPEGKELETGRLLGKDLIGKGYAREQNFMTSRDRYKTVIAFEQTKDIEVPKDCKTLLKWIKTVSNTVILERLLKDKRKTVREAANKRIKETE